MPVVLVIHYPADHVSLSRAIGLSLISGFFWSLAAPLKDMRS